MAKKGKDVPPTEVDKIDWKEFYKLASYQCTQKEIADFFNIDVTSLENYYEQKHGEKLSAFWDKKKGHGRAKLKKIQWEIAEYGNPTMAIWLGKQHLGQTDKAADVEILEAMAKRGVSKEQILELINQAEVEAATKGKRTYSEFCIQADYPAPYPQQIELVNFTMGEDATRLLLGARNYGKTDYGVILGIAYDIYVNGVNTSNLIMSKSKERNASMLTEIKHACEKNGVVFEKANSVFLRVRGRIGKDHSVSTVTIKTASLRGRHPKRIVLDDPVTEDDTSDATRLLVKKKYNELMKLTKNLVIIGQPAHKYDLYAELRGVVKTKEMPYGTIPELDHDIEAQRLAGVDEASIQASYFLKILSEGATPFDNIKYLDVFPAGQSVAFIDPSHEGGDYTALTILKAHMQGVAVVGFTYKKAWNHCLDDMLPHLKKFDVKKLAFETNALGDQPLDVLRQVFTGIGIQKWRSNTNKHSRIMAAGTYAHMIHLSKQSDKNYINHVVQYEYKAKFDDAPDSLASCLVWVGLIRGKE